MSEEIKKFEVFRGTVVDSNFINKYLNENKISTYINNQIQKPSSTGWIDEGDNYEIIILVESKDYEKAVKLIEKYLNRR